MDDMLGPLQSGETACALSLRTAWADTPTSARLAESSVVLGEVWHTGKPGVVAADVQVAMPPLLASYAGVLEQWRCQGPLRTAQRGPVSYRCSDTLLFAAIHLDEPASAHGKDIAAAAQQAYAALFEVMAAEGFDHLVRCWNYFADINVEQADSRGRLERYRLFNIGRQAAFEAAKQAADVGAPAACALGTRGGPLVVYALAARQAPLCIENPRQLSAYHYPQQYGPKSPGFSRGSVLSDAQGGHVLFISGTASIVGHESLHIGDVQAQTEETLRNIEAVVGQANSALERPVFSSHKLCYKVFVRRADDAPKVLEAMRRILGDEMNKLDVVVLRADVCRAELLLEIEAVGFSDAAVCV